MTEKHTVHFGAGLHIKKAAETLLAAAKQHGASSGQFNDIELTANTDSTVDGILADYDVRQKASAEAYRKSPKGVAAAREADEHRARLQAKHDELMRDLPALDFTNEVAVLDWLCAMQDPSDHIRVKKNPRAIISAFKRAGFEPGVNCGEAFRKGDRDNEFRWLVGQALSTLKTCAIHGIIHKFAAEWKAKFARENA